MHIVDNKKDMAGTAGVKTGDAKITNGSDGTYCVKTHCSKSTAKQGNSRNIIEHGKQNGINEVRKIYNIDSNGLEKAFSNLTVESFSSSEDESDDDPLLVAKSPDKAKDNKHTSRTTPYSVKVRQMNHNSGGELVYNGTSGTLDGHIGHNQLYFDIQNTQIQIPQTVEDISKESYMGTINENDSGTDSDPGNDPEVKKVYNTHSEPINKCLDILNYEKLVLVPEQENILTEEPIQTENRVPSEFYYFSDPVHSIDSTYGTLSSPESITLDTDRLQSLSPVFTMPSNSNLRHSFESDTQISISPRPDHAVPDCAAYTSPYSSLGYDSLSSNPEDGAFSKIDSSKDAGMTCQSDTVRSPNYNNQDTAMAPVTMKIAPPDLNLIRSIRQPKVEQPKSQVSNYNPPVFNIPTCVLMGPTTQTIGAPPPTAASAPTYTIAPPKTAPALNRTPSMTVQSSIHNITYSNAIPAPTCTIAPPPTAPTIIGHNSVCNTAPSITVQSPSRNITCKKNSIVAPTTPIAPPITASATALTIAPPSITVANSIRNIAPCRSDAAPTNTITPPTPLLPVPVHSIADSAPIHVVPSSVTSRTPVHIISPSTNSNRLGITHPQIKPGGVAVTEDTMKESGITRMNVALFANSAVKKIWIHVSFEKEEFYAIDDSGKTSLMKALRQPLFPSRYMEEMYVRIERVKKDNGVDFLRKRCLKNQSVLYIAAVECAEQPLLARYITDVLVELGADPDEVYDDQNSLLHVLCQCGDSHANVLAELLNALGPNGGTCFNVNRTNKMGETPLHVAVQMASKSIAIVKLLVEHKANIKAQDNNGLTPLMISVRDNGDPLMVKVLLQNNWEKDIINMRDKENNTALHFAASNNRIPLFRQKQVISLLMNFGAAHNYRNRTGRVALCLVDPNRKDEIRRIIQRK